MKSNTRHTDISKKKHPDIFNSYIGLEDIDTVIKYYFDNVIRPSVILSDNNKQSVPIIYGNPERWKSVQKDGYHRDKLSRKILAPLIMYKKTNIQSNRNYINNSDPNKPEIFINHISSYNPDNKYDVFDILTNQVPVKKIQRTIIPNFVKISYDGIIWTDKISQMNKLIEAINYSSNSYWGDDRFRFYVSISSFDESVEISDGEDRYIKSNFSMELDGYIIPDSIQKHIAEHSNMIFSTAKIVLDERITD